MNSAAIARAYKNPEQAAEISNPKAFLAPILCWIRAAVDGKNISGVIVATMIRSISSGSILKRLRISLKAAVAISEEASPFAAIWRSTIPVRLRIHSSDVSTIFSRSRLLRIRFGVYFPMAVMVARVFFIIILVKYIILKGRGVVKTSVNRVT